MSNPDRRVHASEACVAIVCVALLLAVAIVLVADAYR